MMRDRKPAVNEVRCCGCINFAELTLQAAYSWMTHGPGTIHRAAYASRDKRSATSKDPCGFYPLRIWSHIVCCYTRSDLPRMMESGPHPFKDEPRGWMVCFSRQVTPVGSTVHESMLKQSMMTASVIPTIAICNADFCGKAVPPMTNVEWQSTPDFLLPDISPK